MLPTLIQRNCKCTQFQEVDPTDSSLQIGKNSATILAMGRFSHLNRLFEGRGMKLAGPSNRHGKKKNTPNPPNQR